MNPGPSPHTGHQSANALSPRKPPTSHRITIGVEPHDVGFIRQQLRRANTLVRGNCVLKCVSKWDDTYADISWMETSVGTELKSPQITTGGSSCPYTFAISCLASSACVPSTARCVVTNLPGGGGRGAGGESERDTNSLSAQLLSRWTGAADKSLPPPTPSFPCNKQAKQALLPPTAHRASLYHRGRASNRRICTATAPWQ